ncbi:hypothetical protein C2845_PM13G06550 [Panicum miliaceum]|uniref:BTB/POZ and MATH domain-containing protein 2-like n=1 Tax=Panicum miliaceum TaxID=4540 RepID=A0A3L6RND4_PANMI|nr:hypothetical protein C2845_PM13G06550 [Panicum miliaceum]
MASIIEADTGTYTFEIDGYSLKVRSIGVSDFVRSGTFTVGGLDWAIRFYPNGIDEDSKQFFIASLELMSSNAEARARYVLGLVGQQAPQLMKAMFPIQKLGSRTVALAGVPRSAGLKGLFKSCDATRYGLQNPAGVPRSMLGLWRDLGWYLVNDRLTIQCEITVIRESLLFENRAESEIEVPPCDMMENFGNLLREKKGVDVTFRVGGETFEAHKIVLAARSPVFKAEFFGPTMESGTGCVTVEYMHPEVFSALLHFIYNDSLPDMGDLEGNDYCEMMWHLLVAAHRYAMDRMKLVCQSIICRNLYVENVATTLALADQHNCDRLRASCIEFIASPNNKDAVAVTQGYADLKRTCPSVFIDLFERKSKLSKHR